MQREKRNSLKKLFQEAERGAEWGEAPEALASINKGDSGGRWLWSKE